MGGIALKIKNGELNKLQRVFAKLSKGYENRVKTVVAQSALTIESNAKALVRVDTGRLRSSIAANISPDGLSFTVGTNVEYATAQEFGLARPGYSYTPYLGPAFEAERPRFLKALRRAMIP